MAAVYGEDGWSEWSIIIYDIIL